MSYTEIYKFKKDGNAYIIGETKNSWRGAMAVWDILEQKYLPPFFPDWAFAKDKSYSRSSEMSKDDGGAMKEVWELYNGDKITASEKITLGTTFDNVIVMKNDIPKVIEAFRNFEGQTSLKEQADILEHALNDDDLMAVAWNQTSVNGDSWANYGGYDTLAEEDIPYNILTQDKHWDLFQPNED